MVVVLVTVVGIIGIHQTHSGDSWFFFFNYLGWMKTRGKGQKVRSLVVFYLGKARVWFTKKKQGFVVQVLLV